MNELDEMMDLNRQLCRMMASSPELVEVYSEEMGEPFYDIVVLPRVPMVPRVPTEQDFAKAEALARSRGS